MKKIISKYKLNKRNKFYHARRRFYENRVLIYLIKVILLATRVHSFLNFNVKLFKNVN